MAHEPGARPDRAGRHPQPLVVEVAVEADHHHVDAVDAFGLAGVGDGLGASGGAGLGDARAAAHQHPLARRDVRGAGQGRGEDVALGGIPMPASLASVAEVGAKLLLVTNSTRSPRGATGRSPRASPGSGRRPTTPRRRGRAPRPEVNPCAAET